jgi:membrane protein DedA with SNARE-associated domain
MLESLTAYLQSADPAMVYFILFMLALLKNIIPPLPGDAPIAFIGYMYYAKLNFAYAVLWPSIGSTVGFMIIYLLSRHFGMKLYAESKTELHPEWAQKIHRFFPLSEVLLVRQRFARHGYLAVLVNRFLLGSRTFIPGVAGLLHLDFVPVLFLAMLSATVWNIILLYGGFLLGKHWAEIGGFAALYTVPVTIAFMLLILLKALKFVRERKAAVQEEKL